MRPTMNDSPSSAASPLTRGDALILQTFGRLHSSALGVAVGGLSGLIVFSATVVLLLKGGHEIGPRLSLLGEYFIGYSVTWQGSIVGLLYGFVSGFLVGWTIAFLRNLFVSIYLHVLKFKANLSSANFLD